jgi:predicted amino acid racemase
MRYPRLIINLNKIRENVRSIVSICSKFGVEVVGVTKVTCGNPVIAKLLVDSGIKILGDSRLKNIKLMKEAGVESRFMLLRIPMFSEIEEAVQLVDIFLVSEFKVVEAISRFSKSAGLKKQVIYMIDIGDLREGVWLEDSLDEIIEASKLEGIEFVGIGTNLGCYGGVIPTREKMEQLIEIKRFLENNGVKVKIVSAGNTAALPLIERNELPEEINQYRIGEAIMLGTDATNNRIIDYLNRETFILEAEIVEIKVKPSVPLGETGRDSLGRIPKFEDKGKIKRAILAIGEQDIDSKGIYPLDEKARILHASSDHLIVDINESSIDYKIGDKMSFLLNYSALLRCMTSDYVKKVFLKGDDPSG